MPTYSSPLHQRRKSMGLTLHQVSDGTKLSMHIVRNLERGDIRQLAFLSRVTAYLEEVEAAQKTPEPETLAEMPPELASKQKREQVEETNTSATPPLEAKPAKPKRHICAITHPPITISVFEERYKFGRTPRMGVSLTIYPPDTSQATSSTHDQPIPPDALKTLGSQLKEQRIAHGLSQRDVARLLGCSHERVYAVEKGGGNSKFLATYTELMESMNSKTGEAITAPLPPQEPELKTVSNLCMLRQGIASGSAMRNAREALGISLNEAGRRIGYNHGTIRDIESGKIRGGDASKRYRNLIADLVTSEDMPFLEEAHDPARLVATVTKKLKYASLDTCHKCDGDVIVDMDWLSARFERRLICRLCQANYGLTD